MTSKMTVHLRDSDEVKVRAMEHDLKTLGTTKERPDGRSTCSRYGIQSIAHLIRRLNSSTSKSLLGWLFRLQGSGHVRNHHCTFASLFQHSVSNRPPLTTQPEEIPHTCFSTELRAGLTTFATMSYIIAVNVSSTPAISNLSSHLLTAYRHPSSPRPATGVPVIDRSTVRETAPMRPSGLLATMVSRTLAQFFPPKLLTVRQR